VVGVDLGSRRTGIAVSDSARTLAFPRDALQRSGDPERDRRALLALVAEEGASVVVIGLPRSLNGRAGPAARGVLDEVAAIRTALGDAGVVVETMDERLTTVTATDRLAAAGKRGPAARAAVDSAAAAVILQSWLDAR
jgi:putative Holliday junction resolvase